MLSITVFPNYTKDRNPYIQDMIAALNARPGTGVVNRASKHTVLSVLLPTRWGKVFIFNWFEGIPDFKYGTVFSYLMLLLLRILKLCGKKIVWIYHNKRPHDQGKERLKDLMAKSMACLSDLIVTHASEGLESLAENYPDAVGKACFLHHPTKNRLGQVPEKTADTAGGESERLPFGKNSGDRDKKYDLLIWGSITPYKGVMEFASWLHEHPEHNLKVCICGGCSGQLRDSIQALATDNVEFIPWRLSMQEISILMEQSHFVLSTYRPESVLSSGILMDSLSYGAKVIGPNVGSFRDYASEPGLSVHTFRDFDEIPGIVAAHRDQALDTEAYRRFLDSHDWAHFAEELIQRISSI